MVVVLQNNNKFRCRCKTCKSILEYSLEDKKLVQCGQFEEDWMILCPCCKHNTKLDDEISMYEKF